MDDRSAAIIEAQDRLMCRYEAALADILSLTDGADMIKSKEVRKLVVRGLAGELDKK